jgi:MerR family transcriptional regulator/heat shock protein HspR
MSATGGNGGNGGVDRERGVFMISVAAELANMHPQTLRIYESKGLITPKRSPKGTRLYSQSDVDRLRRIQEMTAELGMNLAGVEKVFALEQQLERMARRMEALERRTERIRDEFARDMEEQLERARQSLRGELVRYEPRGTALVRVRRVDLRRPADNGNPTS